MIFSVPCVRSIDRGPDRRKYKRVCSLIKNYFEAGAKAAARQIIRHLIEKYPRRVAMVNELEMIGKKLMK